MCDDGSGRQTSQTRAMVTCAMSVASRTTKETPARNAKKRAGLSNSLCASRCIQQCGCAPCTACCTVSAPHANSDQEASPAVHVPRARSTANVTFHRTTRVNIPAQGDVKLHDSCAWRSRRNRHKRPMTNPTFPKLLSFTFYIQSLPKLQPKETTKDLTSCGEKTTKNKNDAQGEVEPVTMRSARPAAAPAPNVAGAVLTRPMRGRALEMSFLEEEKRVAEEVVVVVSTVISTATSTCENK